MATTSNSSGFKTFTATAVAIAEAVRVKLDSSGTISAAGVGEDWIGVTTMPIAASGSGTVQLRSAPGTVEVTAAGAITLGAKLYAAASGKVDDAVNGDFTGYVAAQAAAADGDIIEAIPIGRYPAEAYFETVTTTNVLTAAENGGVYFLSLAGGFTTTLPAVQNGLHFTFIVKTAPTTAYIIASATNDNIIGYPVSSVGADESANGNAAGDQINFVANTALPGDSVEVWSDGTSWFARCVGKATGAITITG